MPEKKEPAGHSVRRLENDSLSSLVIRHLEREIFGGRMPPGSRVNEVRVADALGLSRGPVREACRTLAQLGWLDFIPNRGCFVREVSFGEAMDIYEIRVVHAGLIGAKAAERGGVALHRELCSQVDRMRAVNREGDTREIAGMSAAFHKTLAEASGNRKLAELSYNLHYQTRLFRIGALAGYEALDEDWISRNLTVIDARARVVEEIATGDAARGGNAYADLVARSRDHSESVYLTMLKGRDYSNHRAAV